METRATSPPSSSRRRFLTLAGLVSLTGCASSAEREETTRASGDVDSGNQTTTPEQTTTQEPPLVDDDYVHPEPSANPSWTVPTSTPSAAVEYEVLVENLEVPWDLAFADSGELFITERTGRILRFDAGRVSEVAQPQDAIDAGSVQPGTDETVWWVEGGEGGTLGTALHPDYPHEAYLYVYYTASTTDSTENRVVRYDLDANTPGSTEEVIVDGIAADNIHNGGRIRFGPDRNLWITTGDANKHEHSQDSATLEGKILRVAPDGRPLSSNPGLGGDPRVFSIGHRNPQGLDWLPDGVPISSEHGPGGRDEVNLLLPGGNYGWPDTRGGPDDEKYDSYTDGDLVAPVLNTGKSAGYAPTGATFYTGDGIPSWRNRFIVGGLASQSLWVVTLTPPDYDLPPIGDNGRRYDADWLHPTYTATVHQLLPDELGRIRHVAQGPDGELYAITSNRDGRAKGRFPTEQDDVLVRLTPV